MKSKGLQLQDSNIAHKVSSGEFQLYFRNINKIDYYINEAEKAEIQRAEQRRDLKKSLELIENYVSKFGIRNFYIDTYYIWKLGQLYERYGNASKAKALYKLVLKHHRGDLQKILLYYDSITQMEKDYWVDLTFYYQMVDFRKDIDTLHPPHSVLLNMGTEINSKDADYGPAITADKKMLLFTTKRQKKGMDRNIPNENLFYSECDDQGYWGEAKPFKGINTDLNEGSPCLSKDGNTLYFVRCNGHDGYGNCDIYYAQKTIDEITEEVIWGSITNLGSMVNSKAWDSQPSLSHTEDTLYFASDRLGGFGLSDIWFTFKDIEGNWQVPQNLGPIINTRGNEVSPFYHPRFDVLYFSSNGYPLSFGDFDIYKVRRLQGKWDEPRNIGPLVNQKGSEYYFTIDAQSKDLYYAKSEENEIANLDLYSFPLPMEAQPASYTKLIGSLVDSATNKPLKGLVSVIDLDHGIEVAPKFLRPDGTFEFDLINNNRYMLIIQGDDFFSVEEELNIKNDTLIKLVTQMIDYKKPLVLDRIEFEHGSWDITPEMYKSLDLVLKFLLDNPDYKLNIAGHTNSDGNHSDNMILSQNRANAIKDYIILKGKIDEMRIQAIGYGDTKPLRADVTPEDKRINRRVEFEVIKPE
ncbi:MAG: OmpA family protein [Cytophagales bacterium]|nr:OmpA family protein [Cytophagales bacterium]